MSIIFYDHLIDKKDLEKHLDKLALQGDQRTRFMTLIDEILHNGIVEFILQRLHPHQHKVFLSQLEHSPYDPELLSYLKDHIDQEIESQLKQESERLKKLIIKDLKSA